VSGAGRIVRRVITQKNVSLYKVKDASGTERTYHSLEEMPPEIREAFEKAQEELDQRSGDA
jgi:hypothetical protein